MKAYEDLKNAHYQFSCTSIVKRKSQGLLWLIDKSRENYICLSRSKQIHLQVTELSILQLIPCHVSSLRTKVILDYITTMHQRRIIRKVVSYEYPGVRTNNAGDLRYDRIHFCRLLKGAIYIISWSHKYLP